jgi:hypothetical protein
MNMNVVNKKISVEDIRIIHYSLVLFLNPLSEKTFKWL